MRCKRNREHEYEEKFEGDAVDDVVPIDCQHWDLKERTEAMAQREEADAKDGRFLGAHLEASRQGRLVPQIPPANTHITAG